MNRPTCLIGGFNMAEQWIQENIGEEEIMILNQDSTMEEIKFFCKFLNESSLNKKVGIIYFFSNLSESKQSVFLKIFEDLPDFSRVIIHASNFVTFTIYTRCDVIFLTRGSSASKDLTALFSFFINCLKEKSFNKSKKNGIQVYLEALNLKENGFLTEEEKDCILKDLM